MTRLAITVLALVFLVRVPPAIALQDQKAQLDLAATFYESADYELALATLGPANSTESVAISEVRLLCLLALGRIDQAQLAIDSLVVTHPDYHPDVSRVSPSVRNTIERLRVQVIRRLYSDAKARFDAKDFPAAVAGFDRVIAQLDDHSDAARDDKTLADIRMLARAFRELASIDATPAANAAADVPAYDVSSPGVEPPIPLAPILPPLSQEPLLASPAPGLFELTIDEQGRVSSAVVRRSISTSYDALVLAEARNWRYRPAMREGRPVVFRKLVEISAASPQPLTRK